MFTRAVCGDILPRCGEHWPSRAPLTLTCMDAHSVGDAMRYSHDRSHEAEKKLIKQEKDRKKKRRSLDPSIKRSIPANWKFKKNIIAWASSCVCVCLPLCVSRFVRVSFCAGFVLRGSHLASAPSEYWLNFYSGRLSHRSRAAAGLFTDIKEGTSSLSILFREIIHELSERRNCLRRINCALLGVDRRNWTI